MNDERGTMNGGKADRFPDDDGRVFFPRLLVERMLDLHKQLPKAKTKHEREALQLLRGGRREVVFSS